MEQNNRKNKSLPCICGSYVKFKNEEVKKDYPFLELATSEIGIIKEGVNGLGLVTVSFGENCVGVVYSADLIFINKRDLKCPLKLIEKHKN